MGMDTEFNEIHKLHALWRKYANPYLERGCSGKRASVAVTSDKQRDYIHIKKLSNKTWSVTYSSEPSFEDHSFTAIMGERILSPFTVIFKESARRLKTSSASVSCYVGVINEGDFIQADVTDRESLMVAGREMIKMINSAYDNHCT